MSYYVKNLSSEVDPITIVERVREGFIFTRDYLDRDTQLYVADGGPRDTDEFTTQMKEMADKQEWPWEEPGAPPAPLPDDPLAAINKLLKGLTGKNPVLKNRWWIA